MSDDVTELLREAPVASLTLNRVGRLEDHNQEAARLLQRDPDSLVGSAFTMCLAARSVTDFLNHLWTAYRHPDTTHVVSLVILRGDGSKKTMLLKSKVTPKPLAKDTFCPSLLFEPREHGALEADLGLELWERSPYGLAWLDAEERIVECNSQFSELFDYYPAQLALSSIGACFTDWSSEGALAAALAARAFRLTGVRRNSTLIPIEAHLRSTRRDLAERTYLVTLRDLRVQESLERRSLRIAELERRAVGRELHDALGQNLVGMAFLADELASALSAVLRGQASLDTESVARAERLARICRESVAMSRNLVRGLVPVGLDQGALAAALRDLVASLATTHGIACLAHCENFEVETEMAQHLFRIAQEAMTNALKHGECTTINLHLAEKKDRVLLTVTDNGIGIQAEGSQRFGSGLHSMRHRCRLIGARLSVRQRASGGTSVTVSLPRHQTAHPRELPAAGTSPYGA